jgi:hypothetical protein
LRGENEILGEGGGGKGADDAHGEHIPS